MPILGMWGHSYKRLVRQTGQRVLSRFDTALRLSEDLQTQSELIRARACCAIAAMFIVTQCVNLIGMTYSYRSFTTDHSISIAVIIVLIGTIVMIRWNKHLWHMALIYSAMILTGVFSSAWPQGTGINTSLLPMFMLGIMINGFIAGWRAALIFGAVALASIWALWWNSSGPDALQVYVVDIDTRNFQRAMQFSLATATLSLASALFAYYMDKAFEKLEAGRDIALQSDRAKTEFLSTVSHELLTPLNAVIGLSDALRRTPVTSEQDALLKIIHLSGDSLETMLRDVLEYTLLDTDQLELDRSPLKPVQFIEETCEFYRDIAKTKGLGFNVLLSPDLPDHAMGDRARVTKILSVLLDNAVQFTSEGRIEVSVVATVDHGGHLIGVSIADTGSGICETHQAQIFDCFTQANGSIKRSHGGLGLGLCVSLGLARAMGGDLRLVQSTPEGTRFVAHFRMGIMEAEDHVRADDPIKQSRDAA